MLMRGMEMRRAPKNLPEVKRMIEDWQPEVENQREPKPVRKGKPGRLLRFPQAPFAAPRLGTVRHPARGCDGARWCCAPLQERWQQLACAAMDSLDHMLHAPFTEVPLSAKIHAARVVLQLHAHCRKQASGTPPDSPQGMPPEHPDAA